MTANRCVMWRNGCRLFVLAKLERGTPVEYPIYFGTDAEDACPEPRMANGKRPRWSETGHYSLPMTKPDA
ncbi:MAG: hypothetical protein FIA99_18005 [Ruminiclostridium sp.]|nr:hypothetical protein [Ruminiclostridium sp.]